jgi:hypothetical protein
MSDIQPTEAEREEARKVIAAHDNIPSQYLQVDDFTVERVAEVIARIRADAVKSERESLATKAVDYCFRRGMIISTTCGAAEKLYAYLLAATEPKPVEEIH